MMIIVGNCVNLLFLCNSSGSDMEYRSILILWRGGQLDLVSINCNYGERLCNNTMKANNFRLANRDSTSGHFRQSVSILSS